MFAVQHSGSVTHTHTHTHIYTHTVLFILFSTVVYHGDIEYSSLCYPVGPLCFSILRIVVCIIPNSFLLSPTPSLVATASLFSASGCLFLFHRQVHSCRILDFTWVISHGNPHSQTIHTSVKQVEITLLSTLSPACLRLSGENSCPILQGYHLYRYHWPSEAAGFKQPWIEKKIFF